MGNCQNMPGCQNSDGCCSCHASLFIRDFYSHYKQINTVHDSRCSMEKCCSCCSHLDAIQLYVEWYENNLQKEINERKIQNRYFAEKSIWYLIKILVDVVSYQLSNKILNEDIQPLNVFLNQQGEIFLSDQTLMNSIGETYYQIKNKTGSSFPAPEVLDDIHNNQDYQNRTYNEYQAAVWMIGLTVLNAASLQPVGKIYDYKQLKIQDSEIDKMVSDIQGNYSHELIHTINNMLIYDPNSRITMADLKNHLRQQNLNLSEVTMFDNESYQPAKPQETTIVNSVFRPPVMTSIPITQSHTYKPNSLNQGLQVQNVHYVQRPNYNSFLNYHQNTGHLNNIRQSRHN